MVPKLKMCYQFREMCHMFNIQIQAKPFDSFQRIFFFWIAIDVKHFLFSYVGSKLLNVYTSVQQFFPLKRDSQQTYAFSFLIKQIKRFAAENCFEHMELIPYHMIEFNI